MGSTLSIAPDKTSTRAKTLLDSSAKTLFLTTTAGQWLFALYVVGLYVVAAAIGNFEEWNRALPHGYEAGNLLGNTSLGIHLVIAALISFAGPVQLMPRVRAKRPRFHRWTGRAYVASAFLMSMSGLHLILSGRKLVGDSSQHWAIFINAVIILTSAVLTLRYALGRNLELHRQWALRLFASVSGVWLFRIGLMFWLVVHQAPVGFDKKTFSGPLLTVLAVSVYVLPVLLLEVYLRASKYGNSTRRVAVAAGISLLTAAIAIGIFGAVVGLWLPRLTT